MLDAGKFPARPTGADLGVTGTGTDQIGIAFELLGGPNEGQSITAYRYFSDAAIKLAIKDMRTCGWRGDDVSDVSSIGGHDAPTVELVIEHESYTNPQTHETKVSAKVKWINSLNSGGVQMNSVMDAGQRASFKQRMAAKVRAINAEEAQAAKSSGSRPAPTRQAPPPRAAPPPSRRAEPPPHTDGDFGPPPPGFDDERPY